LFSGLGLLSPLISGIASLFGGHSAPAPLPIYVPPSPVSINATLNSATPNTVTSAAPAAATPASSAAAPAPNGNQTAAAAPQVTVNVTAMDSRSFMDHSTEIANAVREAMLNMHPINGVVASL
jgi:hypothetical protein